MVQIIPNPSRCAIGNRSLTADPGDLEAVEIDADTRSANQNRGRVRVGHHEIAREDVATRGRDEHRVKRLVPGEAACIEGTRLVDFHYAIAGKGRNIPNQRQCENHTSKFVEAKHANLQLINVADAESIGDEIIVHFAIDLFGMGR